MLVIPLTQRLSQWTAVVSICLLAFKAVLGECGIGLPNNAAPLCPLHLSAMYVMDEPGPDAYDSAM